MCQWRSTFIAVALAVLGLSATARAQEPPAPVGQARAIVRDRPAAKAWALLIGVNRYQVASDLNFPDRDMDALSTCLRDAGFDPEHIVLMTDQAPEATHKPASQAIRRSLDDFLGPYDANAKQPRAPGRVGPDDLLVVAFSGHGVHLDGVSYFCPSDAQLDDPKTLIPLDELYARLAAAPARQKLLLVDACRNDPRQKGVRAPSVTGAKQLVQTLERPPVGLLVLSSCSVGQFSYEDQALKQGVFSHYVVEALSGAADDDGDGSVTLLDLYRYAARTTESHVSTKLDGQQRPMLKGELSGDFEIGSRHERYREVLDSGKAALAQNRYDRAIADFDAALALAPRSVDARLGRGEARLGRNDTAAALADCNEALRIRPESVDAYLLRAQVSEHESQLDLALRDLEQALALDPKNPKALFNRGWLRWSQGELEPALADATAALELDPKYGDGFVLRTVVLRDLGDARAAQASARAGLAVFEPKTPDDDRALAQLKSLSGDVDGALAALDRLIVNKPLDPGAYNERGNVREQKGELELALADYRKAAELAPKAWSTHATLGSVLLRLGRPDEAIAAYDAALRLRPSEVSALLGRGQARLDRGDHEAALVDFTRVIDLHPDNAQALHARGDARFGMKQYPQAVDDYAKALEHEPANAAWLADRALAAYWNDDLDRADADTRKAISLDPDLTQAHNVRGHVFYARDQYDEAMACYTRAIELSPKDPQLLVNRGNAHYWKGDLDAARADFDQALALEPDHSGARNGLLKLLYRKGEGEEARKLGDALRELKQLDQATRDGLSHKAVVRILNQTSSKTIYHLRWKLWDGSWTDWFREEIEEKASWRFWHIGATAAQAKFDGKTGNEDVDEVIADLEVAQIDGDPDDSPSPRYAFRIEGDTQVLESISGDVPADTSPPAGPAPTTKAVVCIRNPTVYRAGDIHYYYRWQRSDGSWGDWADSTVKSGEIDILSSKGATAFQVEFDQVWNDQPYTPTRFNLGFHNVPVDHDPQASDGTSYFFAFQGNTLGIYADPP